MTADMWQPILQAGMLALGGILVAMMKAYIPRAIAAFETWVNVKLTDQERAAVYQAADTAAGIIRTQIEQGRLKPADVDPNNTQVRAISADALARVPDAANAQKTTVDAMAHIVVGKSDTTIKSPVQTMVVEKLRPA